jgi:hypothetical protein
MRALVLLSLSSYALTFVIASSAIFEPFRVWFMAKTPRLKIGEHKHMIECRMCVGFWMSLVVCNTDWKMILPVYGLAYFLATQER